MTDAGRVAACQLEAASRTVPLAERSSGMRAPIVGRLGRRWACSRGACEGFEGLIDLVAVAAGGYWVAPRGTRLGWSRRRRSHCSGWALARSGMPVCNTISFVPNPENVVQRCAAHT